MTLSSSSGPDFATQNFNRICDVRSCFNSTDPDEEEHYFSNIMKSEMSQHYSFSKFPSNVEKSVLVSSTKYKQNINTSSYYHHFDSITLEETDDRSKQVLDIYIYTVLVA